MAMGAKTVQVAEEALTPLFMSTGLATKLPRGTGGWKSRQHPETC